MFNDKCPSEEAIASTADVIVLNALRSKTNLELLDEIEALFYPPPGEYIDTGQIEQRLMVLEEKEPVTVHFDVESHWNELKKILNDPTKAWEEFIKKYPDLENFDF